MSRPWVKFLLIGSLALNLLVVGAFAGMAWRGGWSGAAAGQGNLFGFMAQLPKERREALQRRAQDLRPQIRDLRETVRTAARERAAALVAEPFERQRYINAQTRQIEADTKLRLMMRDVIAEAASGMTLDERRAFLNWRGTRRMMGDGADEPPAKQRP